MRNWFWLLISLPLGLPAAAQVVPPARVEIEYELKRNGRTMAAVVERLSTEIGATMVADAAPFAVAA